MGANLAGLLYLVSGILFILALRGLSSPATSRQGNRFGIAGMTIAVVTTLWYRPPADAFAWLMVIVGLGAGAGMTRMRGALVDDFERRRLQRIAQPGFEVAGGRQAHEAASSSDGGVLRIRCRMSPRMTHRGRSLEHRLNVRLILTPASNSALILALAEPS